MFQNFDDIADPSRGPLRVAKLREQLVHDGLDGYLIPRADEHQGEYVPPSAERLSWLTGFSGSAGAAVVLADAAALFVDGRYTVQARAQVDADTFEILQVPNTKLSAWLGDSLKAGDKLGYDPRLHTIAEIERLGEALAKQDTELVASRGNLVDAIWQDRPAEPLGQIAPHELRFAGQSAADKIADLQAQLVEAGDDATVLTLTDSIAWTFNIRGSDVAHTPVPLAFAILHAQDRPEIFIDERKLGDNARGHLGAVATIRSPEELSYSLSRLGQAEARVRLDPNRTAQWFAEALEEAGALITRAPDPCLTPKARKNAVEISGARKAQLRDGIAVTRFLAWLDIAAPAGGVDEIVAAKKLEEFRSDTGELKEISFDTISGAGPNGAIVHYRVTRSTNRALAPGELYLVDSGGQYEDGTTDITRTIAIGGPSDEMRTRFTLVLKAHIAIATARFPQGTRGCDIDPLARHALWQAGLDFDHGTGHGVGSYLSVHEGPASISKRGAAEIEPGMILSNEPGYYKEGAYGIRIENLVLVGELEDVAGGERPMMSFETLTLAPIDRRLVAVSLLSDDELAWLNAYHALVAGEIGPHLQDDDRSWLKAAAKPLTRTAS